MTDAQRSYLRGKRYESTEKMPVGRPKSADKKNDCITCNNKGTRTVDEMAKQLNVCPTTISNDFKFSKAIDEVRETDPNFIKKSY